ncbi:MAG: nucleotidyltransferase domain-containing protein [Bacteroidota bacterium]|nr:nucleotidyltransferase domain-containing protein [Bacteroidota bacterium]
MLTQKALNIKINDFLTDLTSIGIVPSKAILFGSYHNGGVTEFSDIDLAVWSEAFTGNPYTDTEKVARLLSKHHPIELHAFTANANEDEYPFISEIIRTGKLILI